MIGIVATLKIKEGSGSDFEAIATQLVDKVNANEDGVVYYDLYKEDDTTYVFLERYKAWLFLPSSKSFTKSFITVDLNL